MKALKPNTKVNAIVYYEKKSKLMIMSSDMNMSFDDYNQKSLGKTQSMYNLDYKLNKTFKSQGHTFTLYVCENNDVSAQFVELS